MNEKLQKIINVVEDKQVVVVVNYDVRQLSTFADTFVIAVAKNDRQIQAVMNEFRDQFKGNGDFRIEGTSKDGWVAIQYEEICVHLFLPEVHDTYHLDKLFNDCPVIK